MSRGRSHTAHKNSTSSDRETRPVLVRSIIWKASRSRSSWLPRDGTNGVVKQFLYGGAPDSVSFGARLQRIAADEAGRLRPVFDRGAGVGDASYAAVVLAMPPKDILKFFDASDSITVAGHSELPVTPLPCPSAAAPG